MRHLSTYDTYNPLDAVLDEEMEHVGHYGGGVWDIILTAEVRAATLSVVSMLEYYSRYIPC